MINNEQKQQLISLLHKDYRDCTVQFINSKTSFILYKIKELFRFKYFDPKHYHKALTRKIDGSYSSKFKISQIYSFNFDKHFKENDRDYLSVFVLFHELRHHYQNKYNRLGRHDIEKDCHSFAWRMLQKHHESINDILRS